MAFATTLKSTFVIKHLAHVVLCHSLLLEGAQSCPVNIQIICSEVCENLHNGDPCYIRVLL